MDELKSLPQGNAVSMSALESAEWFVSRPSFFFILDKTKLITFRTGHATAWGALRSDFIEKRSRSRTEISAPSSADGSKTSFR